MRTIYKYELGNSGPTVLQMPKDATVLGVQEQRGASVLWAVVETSKLLEARTFVGYWTGIDETPDDDGVFIGTVQLAGGALAIHYFEENRR